ncbi:YopX family protein [Brevibacillus sp. DP1.3A]|uniref:YopX family protein n=1 Tax=Brevibacillus sp. DP1.3A TaxID=2738867 RepID=UPI00156BB895|nr:YopX family protein [Brevibacillus sp. DP1.3A]UED78101.1 YopX family protein [Brevibacillus sp. DP1.3A]
MQAGREIKFRGKAITENGIECLPKWVYGSLIVADNGDCFITQWKRTVGTGYQSTTYQVIPETVGQSIGLRDKNDKDVYEGDITADCVEGSSIRGYVVRQKGAFFLETGQKWAPYLHVIATKHNEISDWEVIGNIYENPELLSAA